MSEQVPADDVCAACGHFGADHIVLLDRPPHCRCGCTDWSPKELLSIRAQEWSRITGRGELALIGPGVLPPGPSDGSDLLNQQVRIDGAVFTVLGVEWCLVNHGPNVRCPRGYGLLVR